MFTLKSLSKNVIPEALKKAERYRLLNEPQGAESICRDILEADPGNQKATVMLILCLTDQFGQEHGAAIEKPTDLLDALEDPYERAYYEGIIHERKARAALRRESHGSRFVAYDWLRRAMACYENADKTRSAGNEDAILRWNACARTVMQHKLEPAPETVEQPLE